MKKLTIRDIAKQAGVSVATVSYIINGKARCNDTTKQKVLQVMQELNYRPNLAAKALATKRSQLIGFILHQGLLQENPFYTTLLCGMDEALHHDANFDLLIGSSREGQDPRQLLEWVMQRNLDGLVFMGIEDEALIRAVDTLDLPYVLVDKRLDELNHASWVGIDDEQGGYLATSHLLSRGYRNIGFVGDDLKGDVSRLRFDGYQRALDEYGIKPNPNQSFVTDISFEGGYAVADKMSQSGCDAVFVIADIIAFGLLARFAKLGVQLPDDLALVGFDNLPACHYLHPGLSTIEQNVFLKGKSAVELLLKQLKKGRICPEQISIPLALVERQTS